MTTNTKIIKIKKGNKIIAIVIRKGTQKENLKFYTDKNNFLQLGIHNNVFERVGKVHGLTKIKPFTLNKIFKYIYMTKGKSTIEFFKDKDTVFNTVSLNKEDGILIMDVIHRVKFNKNSKAIEIKQGPYQND